MVWKNKTKIDLNIGLSTIYPAQFIKVANFLSNEEKRLAERTNCLCFSVKGIKFIGFLKIWSMWDERDDVSNTKFI